MTGKRQRLDEAVVERGLAESRARARALILAGDVQVEGQTIRTAGKPVLLEQCVTIREKARFVSRGGEKLDHALDVFGIDPAEWTCADFGASTGGFTDCLLLHGARRVYAVDVGYGQLHQRLRDDDRVVIMERTNARTLQSLPEPIDLVVVDVSFISLKLVLPAAAAVLKPGGWCVPLIKPQFEAGREQVGKGGVVRNPAVHRSVIVAVLEFAGVLGFQVAGLTRSPLTGPAGNIEFLAALQWGNGEKPDIESLVSELDLVHESI